MFGQINLAYKSQKNPVAPAKKLMHVHLTFLLIGAIFRKNRAASKCQISITYSVPRQGRIPKLRKARTTIYGGGLFKDWLLNGLCRADYPIQYIFWKLKIWKCIGKYCFRYDVDTFGKATHIWPKFQWKVPHSAWYMKSIMLCIICDYKSISILQKEKGRAEAPPLW